MRILITGATGLIGSEITRICLEQGIKVNYLTTGPVKESADPDYKGFRWKPSVGEIDLGCFQGVDGIINLAGSSVAKRWTASNKKRILESRVRSIELLHTGLSQVDHRVRSFVTASGVSVYPSSISHYYEEDEDLQPSDTFLANVVHSWEAAADKLKQHKISVAKLRIGLVLAREGGALPKMVLPIKNYMGAVFGTGEQWQSWIHIDDLASMFLFALKAELDGVYNAVAPNPVTNAKLTRILALILRKPLMLPNIPENIMKLLLGEMSSLMFESQRVSSKKIIAEGFNFEYTNITTALQDLLMQKSQVPEELA